MKLQFLGGAQTVTGSKTLVSSGKHRFMVDCGLFQGIKELRLRNWSKFQFDPRAIDAILLTHAHLDHSGYLPLLVKQGFRGKIYSSAPTRDLAAVILKDSAHLQEEDAEFANRGGFSKHHPAEPLYTESDVKEALKLFESVPPNHWNHLPGGSSFRLSPSGHILGSTFVEIQAEGKIILFSGDLGRSHPLLYPQPATFEEADYLVVESTYGDRTHHVEDVGVQLSQAVAGTIARGGQLIIPSFAIGRVQDLLFLLSNLKAQNKIPSVSVYLDTPMGTLATEIFEAHPNWHILNPSQVNAMWEITTIIRSRQESIDIMRAGKPAIIIAGSGMASGGRVLHHLASRLPDPKASVLLVGYQAAGTGGRLLRDGISELKIHGKYIPVRAQIQEISGLSAHSDQSETISWLRHFKSAPKITFINHGEPQASDALRVKIRDTFGWKCVLPIQNEEADL